MSPSHIEMITERRREVLDAGVEGPWDEEPDKLEFRHRGLPCILLRNYFLNWCGYVGVPPKHPAHGKPYDEVEVDVHGGLTYAEKCGGEVCHVPREGESDDVWWLGFDAGHSGDVAPASEPFYLKQSWAPERTYRTTEQMIEWTEQLAEQLADMGAK